MTLTSIKPRMASMPLNRSGLSFHKRLEDLLSRSDTSALSTDENGALVAEECYSIDQSDATRAFSYGVYNQDGSRLSVGDTSAFPMFAEVSVDLPAPTQLIQMQLNPSPSESWVCRLLGCFH